VACEKDEIRVEYDLDSNWFLAAQRTTINASPAHITREAAVTAKQSPTTNGFEVFQTPKHRFTCLVGLKASISASGLGQATNSHSQHRRGTLEALVEQREGTPAEHRSKRN